MGLHHVHQLTGLVLWRQPGLAPDPRAVPEPHQIRRTDPAVPGPPAQRSPAESPPRRGALSWE